MHFTKEAKWDSKAHSHLWNSFLSIPSKHREENKSNEEAKPVRERRDNKGFYREEKWKAAGEEQEVEE